MLQPSSLVTRLFRRGLPALAAAAAFAAGAAEAQSFQCAGASGGASVAVSGQAFECSFEVTQGAGQAYLSGRKPYLIQLEVNFTATGQAPRRSYAFWDGPVSPGSTTHKFKFRHIFPPPPGAVPQIWSWSTVCLAGNCTAASSNPDLESSGTIQVSRYAGANRLYAHGLLKPAAQTFRDDGGTIHTWHRLRHLDNFGFTWIGDTAWAAPVRATDAEWTSYLANRESRKVSVVQLGAPHLWMGPSTNDANGNPGNGPVEAGSGSGLTPFQQVAACLTLGVKPNGCSYPVAAFWQRFEQKVAEANDRGIYIFLAGLMEPNRGGGTNDASAHLATVEARAFARYLGGRLAGSYVIFSPGFDSPAITQGAVSLQSLVGNELVKVNPHHLVANHLNHTTTTSSAGYAAYHVESWLSLETVQTGFRDGTLNEVAKQARKMLLEISGASNPLVFPFGNRKPAVNVEAVYDQGSHPTGAYSAYGARMAGYLSWLSGSFGYTWGIGGLWDWGSCGLSAGDPLNVCGSQLPSGFRTPAQGLGQTNANGQLLQMGNLLREYELGHINAREQDRISVLLPASPLEYQKPALARSSRLLAYLPHTQKVRIRHRDNAGYPGYNAATGKWWDPRTGTMATVADGGTPHVSCPTAIECDITNRFYSGDPNTSDRVLVLQRQQAAAAPYLEVDAGRLAEGGDWGVIANLVDTSGAPLGPLFLAAGSATADLREPAAAGNPATGFLVVWAADTDADGREEIHGQRLDGTTLLPSGAAFAISPAGGLSHRAPAVAMDGAGDAVVAWETFGNDAGRSEIYARKVGASLGPVEKICGAAGLDCSQPRLAAGASSGLALAWVAYDDGLEKENVFYQRFGGTGLVSLMAPAQVNTVDAPLFTLDGVAINPATGVSSIRYEGYDGPDSQGLFQQSFDIWSAAVGAELTLATAPPEL